MSQMPRRMPIKTEKLDFTEDGYEDFHATARLNVPLSVGEAFGSGEEQRARAAALIIFPGWDFVDEEGQDIPHTVEGIGMIPQDLFAAMLTRWNEALGQRAKLSPKADASSPPISPNGQEGDGAVRSLSPTVDS